MKIFFSNILQKKDTNIFEIQFNWGRILCFVFFWSYGFMGCFTKPFGITNWLYSFILTVIMLIVYGSSIKYKKEYSDTCKLNSQDLLIFILFFIFILIIGYNQLFKFLHGDQFGHSLTSIGHSVKLLNILFNEKSNFTYLKARSVLQLINIGFLVFLIVILFFEKRLKGNIFKFLLIGFAFISFRLIIQLMGGSGDPHPPFRTFPLWLSSVFLGIKSFTFRLPQMIALNLIMFIIYKYASLFINKFNALFISLVIGSIPLLLASAIIAEFSIWSSLVITYVLINIFLLYFKKDWTINWVRLLSIISIGILMRQTIVAIIPGLYLLLYLKRKKLSVPTLNIFVITILIFLPYLVRGALIGHPALSSDNLSLYNKLIYSFSSSIFWISILNNVMFWAFFIPFCFYKIWRKFEYAIILSILMTFLYLTFYNIRPILWGVGRYQIELTLPFVILGIFTFIFFNQSVKIYKYLLFTPLLILNLYIYNSYKNWNSSYDILKYKYYSLIKKPFGHLIESEMYFPIDIVLSNLKNRQVNYYHYGITYGVMPEIMCDYNVSQVLKQIKINNTYSNYGDDSIFLKLNSDKKVTKVIFTDKEDGAILEQFLKKGWVQENNFKLVHSGTISVIDRVYN